jgi:hypothetical protein
LSIEPTPPVGDVERGALLVQLADLLGQSHPFHQGVDPGLDRRIGPALGERRGGGNGEKREEQGRQQVGARSLHGGSTSALCEWLHRHCTSSAWRA